MTMLWYREEKRVERGIVYKYRVSRQGASGGLANSRK